MSQFFPSTCLFAPGNTGAAASVFKGITRKLFFRPRYDSTGKQNTLGFSGTGNLFPGTVATNGTTTITGTGTTFTKLSVGDIFTIAGETTGVGWFTIANIASDTSLTLNRACVTTASALAYNILNLAYFTGLINQPDPSKRLYPAPGHKQGKNERAKSVSETFDADDSTEIVIKGNRKVEGYWTGEDQASTPQFFGQMKKIALLRWDMDFYELDHNYNLWGACNVSGQLDGVLISTGSFDTVFNGAYAKNVAKIMFDFDVHFSERDENENCLINCELDATLQNVIANLSGLFDAEEQYTSISTSAVTMTIFTRFGSALNKIPFTGLSLSNYVSSAPQPVVALTVSSITVLAGDIVVGNSSHAIGQVVTSVNAGTTINVAMAIGTFTSSDSTCLVYRITNGVLALVGSLNPDVSAVGATTLTMQLTGFVYDSTITGYVPLTSVVQTLSSGIPTGIYVVTFLTINSKPAASDVIQPYIQCNGGDFTIVNTDGGVIV